MNPIDELFRGGLAERSGEVPADMWARIQAGAATGAPAGDELDQLFADGLKGATGTVPAGMWERIAADAVPAGHPIDRTFAAGLKGATGAVPAGMWSRIWAARAGSARRPLLLAAAAVLLLFLGGMAFFLANSNVSNDALLSDREAAATTKNHGGANADDGGLPPVVAGSPTTTDEGKPAGEQSLTTTTNSAAINALAPAAAAAENTSTGEVTGNHPATDPSSSAETTTAGAIIPPVSSANNIPTAVAGVPATQAPERATVAAVVPLPPAELANAVTPLRSAEDQQLLAALTEDLPRVSRRPRTETFRSAPRHRLQAELLFGVAYADQQLTATTADALPLREVRSLSESPKLSYQVSLRGAYRLSDKWVFRGGLTYAEIRNQFEYGVVMNGAVTDVRTNNQLRLLEAPLLLGYQIQGRRLNVSLNAGPVVNLALATRGRFLDPAFTEPQSLTTAGNYRRNTGVGYMASLTTTYQLGKQEPFVLVLEPFFKSYPTALTRRGAPLKEEYWLAGLQLGVRKGF